MSTNITLKEIAEIVGCSISTVSKALNDSEEISADTKDKINRIATFYNYVPNNVALSLKYGKNYSIGVIIPSIDDPFFARVLHGIQDSIVDTEYTIITAITRDSIEREKSVIRKIINKVDAFIISASKGTLEEEDFDHLTTIVNLNKPLVMVDRVVDSICCDKIISDTDSAIKESLQALQKHNKNNVMIVSCLSESHSSQKIDKYYTKVKKRSNTSQNLLRVISNEDQIEKDIKKSLDKNTIDSIIALDQESSFAILKVTAELNYKVPEDITIICCLPEKIAEKLNPQLTTINVHRKTIGKTALDLILSNLNESQTNRNVAQSIKIKSTLVRRQSF